MDPLRGNPTIKTGPSPPRGRAGCRHSMGKISVLNFIPKRSALSRFFNFALTYIDRWPPDSNRTISAELGAVHRMPLLFFSLRRTQKYRMRTSVPSSTLLVRDNTPIPPAECCQLTHQTAMIEPFDQPNGRVLATLICRRHYEMNHIHHHNFTVTLDLCESDDARSDC